MTAAREDGMETRSNEVLIVLLRLSDLRVSDSVRVKEKWRYVDGIISVFTNIYFISARRPELAKARVCLLIRPNSMHLQIHRDQGATYSVFHSTDLQRLES